MPPQWKQVFSCLVPYLLKGSGEITNQESNQESVERLDQHSTIEASQDDRNQNKFERPTASSPIDIPKATLLRNGFVVPRCHQFSIRSTSASRKCSLKSRSNPCESSSCTSSSEDSSSSSSSSSDSTEESHNKLIDSTFAKQEVWLLPFPDDYDLEILSLETNPQYLIPSKSSTIPNIEEQYQRTFCCPSKNSLGIALSLSAPIFASQFSYCSEIGNTPKRIITNRDSESKTDCDSEFEIFGSCLE